MIIIVCEILGRVSGLGVETYKMNDWALRGKVLKCVEGMSGYGGARIHVCRYLTFLLFNGVFFHAMEVLHPCIWRFFMYMEKFFFSGWSFQEFGMICPIQGCPASSLYRKLDQLKRHWYNIHVPEIMMHQCSYCRKDFVEKRHAKSHVKSHRTPAGSSIAITEFKKRNNRYMSPGPATLPRPRTTPRSTVTHLSAREQAAERLRGLADVCNQSQVAQLSERGACIDTRDKEAVQRADGSTVRQPKKHWRGSGDDVVELYYIDDL